MFLIPDKNIMAKSGRILITSDVGDEYHFKDITGKNTTIQNAVQIVIHLAYLQYSKDKDHIKSIHQTLSAYIIYAYQQTRGLGAIEPTLQYRPAAVTSARAVAAAAA